MHPGSLGRCGDPRSQVDKLDFCVPALGCALAVYSHRHDGSLPSSFLLCPEFRPAKINFTTCARKSVTMVIIFSARKRCGDQLSSSSESGHAASQTARTKYVARRRFRKSSEMWNFARRWRGFAPRSTIRIEQTESVPCSIRTILRRARHSLRHEKFSTTSPPDEQFVQFSDRYQRLFPEVFCYRTVVFRARAFSHSMVAPFGT